METLTLRPIAVTVRVRRWPGAPIVTIDRRIIASSTLIARARMIEDVRQLALEWLSLYMD